MTPEQQQLLEENIERHSAYARELRLMATKSAILLNGGAAVALLAFLGTQAIASTGSGSVTAFALALGSFTVGAFMAVISVEVRVYGEYQVVQDWMDHGYFGKELKLSKRTHVLIVRSARFVHLAFLLFGVGVIFAFLAVFWLQSAPVAPTGG